MKGDCRKRVDAGGDRSEGKETQWVVTTRGNSGGGGILSEKNHY